MQVYDLIMLIVLGMSTIFGVIKGLAWQVASLASILVSYIVACNYRVRVAQMIDAQPPWNMFLAMLILYVGTGFVIWVGFRLMSSAIDKIRMKQFDRQLGGLFGFGKGVIFCLLITMFAMTLLGPKQQAAICQSRSGYYMAAFLDKAVVLLPKEVHSTIGEYLARLDHQLKNGQQNPNNLNAPGEGLLPANLEQYLPDQLKNQLPGMSQQNGGGWFGGSQTQTQPNSAPAGFPGLNGIGGMIETATDNLLHSGSSAPQVQPAGNSGFGSVFGNNFGVQNVPTGSGNIDAWSSGLRPTNPNGGAAQLPGSVFPR